MSGNVDNVLIFVGIFLQVCLCKEAGKLACYMASTQAGANTQAGCPMPDDNVSWFFFSTSPRWSPMVSHKVGTYSRKASMFAKEGEKRKDGSREEDLHSSR